jgi:hypothetical protein
MICYIVTTQEKAVSYTSNVYICIYMYIYINIYIYIYLTRVDGGIVDRHTSLLEHVKQSRLSGIV